MRLDKVCFLTIVTADRCRDGGRIAIWISFSILFGDLENLPFEFLSFFLAEHPIHIQTAIIPDVDISLRRCRKYDFEMILSRQMPVFFEQSLKQPNRLVSGTTSSSVERICKQNRKFQKEKLTPNRSWTAAICSRK